MIHMERVALDEAARIVLRLVALDLDELELCSLIGRVMRLPGAVALLDGAMDDIEHGRAMCHDGT